MSVTRTFTVTVANAGGNKYFIDGVQQATLNLAEGGTYKFDQSDNSNNGHPLKLSTTSNGTHSGGSEYTTGVTYNGTPGQAGAYTQIVVATSAPTLYYYCQYHSGMGGQANTVDDNTYGMWAWGTNEWGDQGPIEITLSGQSAATSLGTLTIQTAIQITGQEAETDLGSLTTTQLTNVALTGLQAQTELGTFDNAGTLVGWGRNGWGEEPYGDSFNSLVQPAGLSATSSVGSVTAFDTTTVIPTGVSSDSDVGSLGFSISPVVIPTGLPLTSSVGAPSITQATVGLTGLGMTSAVGGIVLDALIVELDSLSTTSSVGGVTTFDTKTVIPTGVSATSAVGSLVPEIGVPVTGLSTTSAVGSLSFVFSIDLTLTGVQATTELNDNLILKYFGKLTPKDSTGYSTKTPKNSTGYTRKTA